MMSFSHTEEYDKNQLFKSLWMSGQGYWSFSLSGTRCEGLRDRKKLLQLRSMYVPSLSAVGSFEISLNTTPLYYRRKKSERLNALPKIDTQWTGIQHRNPALFFFLIIEIFLAILRISTQIFGCWEIQGKFVIYFLSLYRIIWHAFWVPTCLCLISCDLFHKSI